MSLPENILRAIEADEQTAQAATPGPWSSVHYEGFPDESEVKDSNGDRLASAESGYVSADFSDSDARHIARHDPARVLARCQADRDIVALHSGGQDCGFACRNTTCPTLRALAAGYGIEEEA